MRHGAPNLAVWALRTTGVIVLIGLVGVGCVLSRSGTAAGPMTQSCSVTVHNAAGATKTLRGDDAELQALAPRRFLSGTTCDASDQAGLEDDFLRWVQANVPFRYDGEPGPWCIQEGTVDCVDPVSAPEGAVCETALPTPPTFCPAGAPCLVLTPSEIDYSALLAAQGESETRSLLGLREGRLVPLPRVAITNTCSESVRVYLDDSVQGVDPDDFALVNNSCAPRPGTDEERIGRELLAAGSGGEECGFEVEFTPMRRTARMAEKTFSQDTTIIYTVPLSGLVRGGTLRGLPAMLCFDALAGPRPPCGSATAARTLTLENLSPARMMIETVVPTSTAGFQVTAPALPFALEPVGQPGSSQPIDIWWCGDGRSGDDDGSLLITHNGFDSPVEVTLQRRSAGCP